MSDSTAFYVKTTSIYKIVFNAVLVETPIYCTNSRNISLYLFLLAPVLYRQFLPYEEIHYFYVPPQSHAVAQAVSRWLPTAAASVESSGICGGQSGGGAGFLPVLRFPLPIFIPQSPSPIIRRWYNRPVVAAIESDSVSPH
jgi:hypothetical protein